MMRTTQSQNATACRNHMTPVNQQNDSTGVIHGADSGFNDSGTEEDQPLMESVASRLNHSVVMDGQLPSHGDDSAWLKQCLIKHNMGHFIDNFVRNGIVSSEQIASIQISDLKSIGIAKSEDQQAILQCIMTSFNCNGTLQGQNMQAILPSYEETHHGTAITV